MVNNKKQETANYVMAAIAGAALLIVLREIVESTDDTENFKGFGINWGTSGYVYTDSRNKGLILTWKELFLLFSNSKSKVLLGYGWFDYEIDRDGYLNILVPDFRFVTDIKMIAKDDKNDFIISDNANKNLPQKNENK